MKAVIYESSTGFTKKYAAMLAEKWHIPAYTLAEAKTQLDKKDDVFFLGWVCAQKVQGYQKANRRYTLCGIAAVGMNFPSDDIQNQLAAANKIANTPFFVLQGGIAPDKLSGGKKRILNFIATAMEKAGIKNENDQTLLKALRNGKNFVGEKNLQQILKEFAI